MMESSKMWFKLVEIEVNSRCNNSCKYCPVSILPPIDVPQYMSAELFDRILDELVRIKYSGKISYHFYSEPLLRKDLDILVRMVTKKLPESYQVLFSNGILLSEEKYAALKDAGIALFIITNHNNANITKKIDQIILVPDDLKISNRGGTLFKIKKPLSYPCHIPNESLIITITGDILLCCDDARRTQIMGNIINQSLEEIWFSDIFVRARKLLKKGHRRIASDICRYCNNTEYVEPGNMVFQ